MIQMIRQIPEKYAANSSFGISVERLPAEELSAAFFQELTSRFSAAEVPYYLMENPLQMSGLQSVVASSLTDSGILENLSLNQEGLICECITGISRNIRNLSERGISSGILDFDLNSSFLKDREDLYLKILKGFANVLEQSSFTILLPVSVPFVPDAGALQILYFLRRTLLPWVKIRLDVYCHELAPGYSPENIAGPLFPEIRAIRFLYQADSGNVLIPEHILPWVGALAEFGFRGPYLFTPSALTLNGLPAWISSIENLMGKLEK